MNDRGWQALDRLFHPGNVAIIGASPSGDIATPAHMATKIRERLYFVNPRYTEILGRKCYPSIKDVDVPIDYVIVVVNARLVIPVITECIEKGVKGAHIYTAGFGETGLPEGLALESELRRLAAGKIRIIGPNCFGIYCPKSGLAIVPESSEETGEVGVITQSGSVAESFSYFGKTRNIRFSKVVSYGNAVDLDCADFLEYMADDAETKVIALYVEGTRDGRRLKKALTYAADRKPVIAIKGGLTGSGNRVAQTHTNALTGAPEVWRTLFRQSGAIQVNNFQEMVDTVVAFTHSPLPKGNRVAMLSNSGGFSVIQTDLCAAEGLDAHRFSDATMTKLRKLVPVAGTSISNPLDAYAVFYKVSIDGNVAEAIRTIAMDENTDSLVIMFDQFRYLRRIMKSKVGDHMKVMTPLMVEGCNYCRDVAGKPVLANISLDPYLEDEEDRDNNLALKRALEEAGYPVYASSMAAIKALGALNRYAAHGRDSSRPPAVAVENGEGTGKEVYHG